MYHASSYLLSMAASGACRITDTGLRPDDHPDQTLTIVHEAIAAIEQSGVPTDEGGVMDRAVAMGAKIEAVADVIACVGTHRTPEQLAAEVASDACWRRQGTRVARAAAEWREAPADRRDEVRAAFLADLAEDGDTPTLRRPKTQREALDALIKMCSEAQSRGGAGFKTGIEWLDMMIGGIAPGRVYTLSAVTSAGKSCLALQMAAAVQKETPVLYWSGEMSVAECLGRQMCQTGVIDADNLRDGKVDRSSWERALSRTGLMAAEYDDTPSSVEDIVTMVRRWHQRTQGRVVFIDLLQAIRPSGGGTQRVNQIAHITRTLKSLTLELGIAAVLVAHLNRESYKEGGGSKSRQPGLGDLKDSSSIEQDSDVVMFIHPASTSFREHGEWAGILSVAKARIGRCGYTNVSFRGRSQLFVWVPPS